MSPNHTHNEPLSVALLLGSARRIGWTRKLASAMRELAPPTLMFQDIEIANLPLYHEELESPTPPAQWVRFRDEVAAMDALLFVTPEYNRSIPAALKNAIDIGSSPDDRSVWRGKPAAIASFSPGMMGGFGANHHLRQSLVFLDVPVLQQPEIYLGRIDRLFDADDKLHDGLVRELVASFLSTFATWISRTRVPVARTA